MPRISALSLIATPARIQVTSGKALWVVPEPPPPSVVERIPEVRHGFFPEVVTPFVRHVERISIQLQGSWFAVARDRLIAAESAQIRISSFQVNAIPLVERFTRHQESVSIQLPSLVALPVQERCILSSREYYVLPQIKIVLSNQPLDRLVVNERRQRVLAHLWRILGDS